ncbi:MAG: hypothetical protein Q9O74_11175 [Planctomycetota bacterium]|nr:hypothetical protein [Planctomycetota bacterium]
MQRVLTTGVSRRASATRVALAFFCVLQSCSVVAAQEEPDPPQPVGMVTLGESSPGVRAQLRDIGARLIVWLGPGDSDTWAGVASTLSTDQAGTWSAMFDNETGLTLRPVKTERGSSGVFPLDLSLNCNTFRQASPQPFSRTPRGRVLDALTIDNARTARLSLVPAADAEDADDAEQSGGFTLVLFAQSRGEKPGQWHAQPIAQLALAPTRKPDPTGRPRPLELNFGNRRVGVAMVLADLVLALDPETDSISRSERFEAWGLTKSSAVQRLAGLLDGRVWIWSGGASDTAIVAAVPLTRASGDRDVARALGVLFGRRLVWSRGADGRATATLAFKRENTPPAATDRTVSMRFIEILGRSTLVVATDAADLGKSTKTLAEIPPG